MHKRERTEPKNRVGYTEGVSQNVSSVTKTYPLRTKFDQYSITDSDSEISDFV